MSRAVTIESRRGQHHDGPPSLPGGAASALMSVSVKAGDLPPMWAAALVVGDYAVGLAVAGSQVVVERNVA